MDDDVDRPATKGDVLETRAVMRAETSMEESLVEGLRGLESRLLKAFDDARQASDRRLRELPPRQ